MAEETVEAAVKEFKLKPTGRSQTDHIKLIGGHAWSKTMYIKLIQQFGLETEVAKHLSESYGDRAWTVASMAEPTGLSWPLHGQRLHHLYPYIEAEARYAVRREYALTATDFVARRTRLSFLNVQVTLEALPRVIEIMGEELGWDQSRREQEFTNTVDFLRSMGLKDVSADTSLSHRHEFITLFTIRFIVIDLNAAAIPVWWRSDVRSDPIWELRVLISPFRTTADITQQQTHLTLQDVVRSKGSVQPLGMTQTDAALFARAQFTPDEVAHLRAQFEKFDFDHDARITRADLLHAMVQMGYDSSSEAADSILREVDFGRKGAIEFQDYLDIAAGLKELQLESAFTHLAQLDTTRKIAEVDAVGHHADEESHQRESRRKIPVERSGGGT
jgi:glycerol-3-phosphate dehydrogenase